MVTVDVSGSSGATPEGSVPNPRTTCSSASAHLVAGGRHGEAFAASSEEEKLHSVRNTGVVRSVGPPRRACASAES